MWEASKRAREHFDGVLVVARFPSNGASQQKRTSWKTVPPPCHSRQAMCATRKLVFLSACCTNTTTSSQLLREHHDFFLAPQHPSISQALRGLQAMSSPPPGCGEPRNPDVARRFLISFAQDFEKHVDISQATIDSDSEFLPNSLMPIRS